MSLSKLQKTAIDCVDLIADISHELKNLHDSTDDDLLKTRVSIIHDIIGEKLGNIRDDLNGTE